MAIPTLRRQNDCLGAIRRSLRERGVAPSYDELMAELGLNSKSGIHRLVTGLEARGAIRRVPGKARAIEILEGAGTDALAFLDAYVLDRIRTRARAKGVVPEIIVAEICRDHFMHGMT